MCGIAGFVDLSGKLPGGPQGHDGLVRSMLAAIAHRGPDEAGFYLDDHAALATARLAIIDLSSGQQPMTDESGRHVICYNGELYNYLELRAELEALGRKFRTGSDTEVVLQAVLEWGSAALPRFNGAFAFAVWDSAAKRLFMARDRFGKRPLFLARHEGALFFASEIKSFLAVPGLHFEFDPASLAAMYAVWTPLPGQTCFAGISQLPEGCFLTFNENGERTGRYHELRFESDGGPETEPEAARAVRSALERSVDLRLRSDVEVAVYLSGGLDSAIVTDLTCERATAPVHTFSVEFADEEYDESADQRLVAAHYGTLHESVRVKGADIASALPEAVYHAETPVFRTAFVPMFLLSAMVREAGVKVVLSGEGADEAFLGYNIFKETLLRRDWETTEPEVRKARLAGMYPYLKHFSEENLPHLLAMYQRFAEEREPGLFSHEMRFQNGQFAVRLLAGKHEPLAMLKEMVGGSAEFAGLGPVQRAQWLEFRTLLSGYLLSTQGERMGLAHAVENRCPFLDPDVVDLAARVNLRFNDGFDEKYPLKLAFSGRVPEPVLRKKKFPYRAPDAAVFAEERPDYLDLILSPEELAKMECINPKFAALLAKKVLGAAPGEVGLKESSAFIFLVTTALVHHRFVQRRGLPAMDESVFDGVPTTVIDRRYGSRSGSRGKGPERQ